MEHCGREELEAPTEEEVELEELKNLDSAITQALEFLGQVYVSLSGFYAVEEFLCEQYAASMRFVLRRFSGCSPHSNFKVLSREHLTSRKSPARSSFKQIVPKSLRIPIQQRNSSSTKVQIDQTTLREGYSDSDDSRRLKAIESLCESIDSVLSKAKRVREKCTTANVRRKVGISRLSLHPKSTGKGDVMSVTTSEDARTVGAKSVTVNENKIFTVAKPGERAKKLVSKESTEVTMKQTSKSLKPSPRTVEASDHFTEGTRVMSQSTNKCQPPDMNISTAEGSDNGFADESPLPGKKKSRLQFPEKLCRLLDWFKSRGISLEDPLNIPRAEAQAAKEDFLSILDEVNNQQDYPENKESREAAARIEETQRVLKELASQVSPFEMSWLLRTAPAGSTIGKQRDTGIQNVMRAQLQEGASAPDPQRYHVNYSCALTPHHRQIRTVSWLPQNCWPYFGRVVESLKHGDTKDLDIAQMLQKTFTCYTNPKHVLVMTRLWHIIQMTTFQCYLEDVIAAPLLPTIKPLRNELSLMDLFRYRLAHSILCKEGRGLMVMAERVVTPF